jgi:hypothetical protein
MEKSQAAVELATARWANVSKEDRLAHVRKMVRARLRKARARKGKGR